MKSRFVAFVAVAAVVALASGASAQDTKVELKAQNNSNESGTATLTPAGDSTKVVLDVKGAEGSQPTHIHKGTCDKLDPKPAFPLSPVTGGKSETTVKASLDELHKGYAINGHKSAQDLKTYVFCGDIKKGM